LVRETTPEEAYRLFLIAKKAGKKGLVITRIFPQKVRERFGLSDLPILWLSNVGKEDTIRPKALEKWSLAEEQFLSREKGAVRLAARRRPRRPRYDVGVCRNGATPPDESIDAAHVPGRGAPVGSGRRTGMDGRHTSSPRRAPRPVPPLSATRFRGARSLHGL